MMKMKSNALERSNFSFLRNDGDSFLGLLTYKIISDSVLQANLT
jgi:hypothetical protein